MPLVELTDFPPMSRDQINKVRTLEALARAQPQVKIHVDHFLHGGMYVRTVMIPAGVLITGALIRVETSLVMSGSAMVYTGERWIEHSGYGVLAAAKNRKQIFIAITDLNLTMFFPCDCKTVKDAEEQFTSEASLLQSRG